MVGRDWRVYVLEEESVAGRPDSVLGEDARIMVKLKDGGPDP